MSILLLAAAGFAVARDQARLVLEIEQRGHALVDFKDNAAAAPTVATRGTAKGPILLAQESDRTVATLAGLHVNSGFVDKAHNWMEL